MKLNLWFYLISWFFALMCGILNYYFNNIYLFILTWMFIAIAFIGGLTIKND
jgi:hypothetical protein